jgi:hypothetical protein
MVPLYIGFIHFMDLRKNVKISVNIQKFNFFTLYPANCLISYEAQNLMVVHDNVLLG